MVGDVAEVAAQLLGDAGRRPRSSASSGGEQRADGAVELDHLALEEVDALGRVGCSSSKTSVLDLLDVVLDARDDGLVVVDDLVEDRPDDRGRAELQQIGVLLQLAAAPASARWPRRGGR